MSWMELMACLLLLLNAYHPVKGFIKPLKPAYNYKTCMKLERH